MGRTILSATQTWVEEEKALGRFVRALRKRDQDVIEELLALSRQHIAEASYASNLYPMDIYLVTMLLEMYKKVKLLERKLEELGGGIAAEPGMDAKIPELPSLVALVTPPVPPGEVKTAAVVSGVQYVDFQDEA